MTKIVMISCEPLPTLPKRKKKIRRLVENVIFLKQRRLLSLTWVSNVWLREGKRTGNFNPDLN